MYYLIDPRTNEVRYVGISNKPYDRLRGHLKDRKLSHKRHWIQLLQKEGLKPHLKILCVVETYNEAKRIEMHLITKLRSDNVSLTNITDGGEGATGLIHSPETRLKISKAFKGKPLTSEHKDKISKAFRPFSPAHLASIQRANKRPITAETRAKLIKNNYSAKLKAMTKLIAEQRKSDAAV